MTVRDLIGMNTDIDVYDDVCEELAIAYVGPMELTEEGEKQFAEVMGYGVELNDYSAVVQVDDPDEDVFEDRLRKAKEFFEAAAGYCADSDYHRWFKD